VTGYGVTLKQSNSKYKFRYNLIGSTLIFRFLCLNILNSHHFLTESLTFFKNKKRWENKKTLKNAFFYRKTKKTFINVYYNYELA